MHWLSHLKKPAKVFVIIMMFVTFLSIAIIVYLEVTNNSISESISHYFVGDTESEITVEEVIPYEKQEVKDDNLDEGVTETRQEGKDGKKKIIFRVTMDKDGNEIDRTYAGEEIITEAVDEIIAIGTKVSTPSSNNNGGGQGSWSGNSGSQPSNSGNGSNNSSQPSGNGNNSNQGGSTSNPVVYYYCASNPQHVIVGWEPVGDGSAVRNILEWQVYYRKTNRPCSELRAELHVYLFDITSEEYYSQTDISSKQGSKYYIETRILHCGQSDPHENVCKPYVTN